MLKKFPLLGVATNNAAPRLVLFDDRIEFRVITRQRRRYEDLESIDVRQTLGTQNIVLYWRRGVFAFSANLGTAEALFSAVKYFRDRGINLNERATKLLAEQPAS